MDLKLLAGRSAPGLNDVRNFDTAKLKVDPDFILDHRYIVFMLSSLVGIVKSPPDIL